MIRTFFKGLWPVGGACGAACVARRERTGVGIAPPETWAP